jgi:hypothetical protein
MLFLKILHLCLGEKMKNHWLKKMSKTEVCNDEPMIISFALKDCEPQDSGPIIISFEEKPTILNIDDYRKEK